MTRETAMALAATAVIAVMALSCSMLAGQRDRANTERDAAVAARGAVIEACRLKVEPPPAS